MTKTLLQNIEVLSAGQDFKKDAEGKPVTVQVVNLLVTPEQAEKLSLARSQTTIQLVLRNPLDPRTTKTTGHGAGLAVQRRQAAASAGRSGRLRGSASRAGARPVIPPGRRRRRPRKIRLRHGDHLRDQEIGNQIR